MIHPAQHREDRLSLWVTGLAQRRPPTVAAVARANKTVRLAWAMLRNAADDNPELAVA